MEVTLEMNLLDGLRVQNCIQKRIASIREHLGDTQYYDPWGNLRGRVGKIETPAEKKLKEEWDALLQISAKLPNYDELKNGKWEKETKAVVGRDS